MKAPPDISDLFQAGVLPTDPFDGADEYGAISETAPRRPRGRALITQLSDVVCKDIEWLWVGRLAFGKITVLDGDPGLGKSMVSLDIASRLSRGASMPGASPGASTGEPAGVVLLTAEDDPADTLRPRVEAAGGDPKRIAVLGGVATDKGERMPRLSDLDAIGEAVERVAARLIVIDPVMAYLSGDTHRDNEVRQSLGPLAKLASEIGAAVLIVRHLNKSGGPDPLYRGGGSIGIIGAARIGMLIAQDPHDATARVLAPTKSNISEQPQSLGYRIETSGKVGRIQWTGPSPHDARSLLAAGSDRGGEPTAVEEATAWLREELAHGPRPTVDLKAEAKEAGIAWRSVERGKSALKVRTGRVNVGGIRGAGAWVLSLPGLAANDPPKPPS